jgi:type 1 glutamine amidotransferase
MVKKDIWILLGGEWHDFEGFAAAMHSFLEAEGFYVHVTYDPDVLIHLNKLHCDLLLTYTCVTQSPGEEKTGILTRFSKAQVEGVVQWVQSGGAMLAVHAATVLGDSDQALEELLGGVFIRHAPQGIFQVLPLYAQHPITDGINAFNVNDELYIERYHSSVQVHMIAVHEQVAYPVIWSREDGLGRVVHIAPGHSKKTWELEPYQRLMLQSIHWMIKT